jgi:hypothetical protein
MDDDLFAGMPRARRLGGDGARRREQDHRRRAQNSTRRHGVISDQKRIFVPTAAPDFAGLM